MSDFELTIVTPERVTYQGRAEKMNIPAWEGSMGVLPGHQSALVLLREGVVRYSQGGTTQYLSVSGGFAEVHPEKVVLFAETAELSQELDEERARLAATRAREALVSVRRSKGYDDVDVERAQAALRRALVRLKVASEFRRPARRDSHAVSDI